MLGEPEATLVRLHDVRTGLRWLDACVQELSLRSTISGFGGVPGTGKAPFMSGQVR